MGAKRDNTRAWTVVIVEDDARARRHFCQCVQASRQLMLLADFGSVRVACQWIAEAEQAPDVLLTDLGLPDGSGVTVIRRMLARFPDCEPLVISMFDDEEHVMGAIDAGAWGYVQKDDSPENVVQTILDLKAGGSPISPGIARHMLRRLREHPATAPPAAGGEEENAPARLTQREVEMLDMLVRGFTYVEIAEIKKVKYNTVASHVKNLYRKMRVTSRSEAVYEAINSGIVRVPGAAR